MRPSTPAKIWYVLPSMNLGGAEKHVISLARVLRERGYETGILTIFEEGTLASEIRREGIPFVCLRVSRGWGLKAFGSIFKWIRSNPVDILHTYLFGFHLFAGLPARWVGVPAVLSSRRDINLWQKKRLLWMEILGNFFVDRITCCSKAAQAWNSNRERMIPQKYLTIYNGVDSNRFSFSSDRLKIRREFGIPEESVVVGTVANFALEKGYLYLLETISLILKENEKVWFLLVGSGPLREGIEQKAKRLEGHRRIIFTGSRLDVPDLMNAMDIFVLASVTEGFPNVLLESMAMARPVVATAVGGVPELIQTGRDGILVPPKEGQALAQAILALLNDSQLAAQLGSAAGEKISRQYSLNRMVNDYETLYLSLLKGKSERHCEPAQISQVPDSNFLTEMASPPQNFGGSQ